MPRGYPFGNSEQHHRQTNKPIVMICTGNEFKVENYKDYCFRTMLKHKEKIVNQLRQINDCSLRPEDKKKLLEFILEEVNNRLQNRIKQ
jgi:hypothetical protein